MKRSMLILGLILCFHNVPLTANEDEAIEAGVAWLKQQQNSDGSFPGLHSPFGGTEVNITGVTAMSLYALLKSGVPLDDPVVEKSITFLQESVLGDPLARTKVNRQNTAGPQGPISNRFVTDQSGRQLNKFTYQVCAMILALHSAATSKTDRKGRVKFKLRADLKKWLTKCHQWLLDNLDESEGESVIDWDELSERMERKELKKFKKKAPKYIDRPMWKRFYIRYPGVASNDPSEWDNSCLQYVALALKMASFQGVETPKEIWEGLLFHFLTSQEKEGPQVFRIGMSAAEFYEADQKDEARGWSYNPNHNPNPTGSMTTAGLVGVIICLSELKDEKDFAWAKEYVEKSVRDGLAWLGQFFSVEGNPFQPNAEQREILRQRRQEAVAQPQNHYYYLYGLERVGELAGVINVGRHDWYREGADYLLSRQESAGSWPVSRFDIEVNPVLQTAYALLFLRRATDKVGVDSYQVSRDPDQVGDE